MVLGWLTSKKLSSSASAQSLDSLAESQNLEEAMRAASYIMSDDLDAADAGLGTGSSAFHKLGRGLIAFFRAALGFEPDAMKEAQERIADAELSASADHKRASRDPSHHESSIYPPGSEFALIHALCQLMSAVVSVLREDLVESVKGFYKLRKAYVTLDGIIQGEMKYLQGLARTKSARGDSSESLHSKRSLQGAPTNQEDPRAALQPLVNGAGTLPPQQVVDQTDETATPKSAAGEKDEIFDAPDVSNAAATEANGQISNHNKLDSDMSMDSAKTQNASTNINKKGSDSRPTQSKYDERQMLDTTLDADVFSNPIDTFIHSGANLAFGMLQLILSMIPPAFSKLLLIIGFKGDRDQGLRMLWQATKFHNIMGAMAGLLLLGFYNSAVAFCDILPETSSRPEELEDEVQGYPMARLEVLLKDMRIRYPNSYLWLLEQARMQSVSKNLEEAIKTLSGTQQSGLKQVHALAVFERSMAAMNSHNYQLCTDSFVECCTLNNWSHALYYYIAASAQVELYRRANVAGQTAKAQAYSKRATELYGEVRQRAGKKKFMAKQLPFDVFVIRKLNKWEARAKERDCSFIDAVGVSPIEEMIYLWNGLKKMNTQQLEDSLAALHWSEDPNKNPQWILEGLDEQSILHVLRAAIFRNLGRYEDAKALLQSSVLCHDKASFKGFLKDDWTIAVAHYEMGTNCWQQRDKSEEMERSSVNRALVKEAMEWVDKAGKWEAYVLDARIGIKIRTGLMTMQGWLDRLSDGEGM